MTVRLITTSSSTNNQTTILKMLAAMKELRCQNEHYRIMFETYNNNAQLQILPFTTAVIDISPQVIVCVNEGCGSK